MIFTFMLRRGVSTAWAERNPVLRAGEPGVEIDTKRLKIGDGVTPWSELPYFMNENGVEALVQAMINDAVLEGVPGKSAYEIAVDNGFVGTEEEWLESLVGPQGPQGEPGPQGEQGPPGPANLIVLDVGAPVPPGTPVDTVIVER